MLTKYWSFQRLGRYAAVYLFYLGIAILITYPLVTVMSTQMAGDNSGDAYETARHIWWYRHALQTGQPLFYQSLLAYPDGIPGMYLWAIPLRTFPAWFFAFFMPIPAAFNLMLLLRLALNGSAMCWTAYQFTRNRAASLIAGAIYLAFPAMQGHLIGAHVDLLALWAFPLFIWSLFKLSESGRVQYIAPLRRILLTAALFVVSLLGSFVLMIYMLLPIMAVFVLWRLLQRDWRTVIYSIVGAALGGVISLIFVLPAVLELLAMPALHEGGSVRYSADLLAAVSPSFLNPLYQNLGYNRQVLGINLIEGSGYLGFVVGLLALISIWRVKAARWWLALAFVAWVFSLGPLLNINGAPVTMNVGDGYQTYIPLPWALFQSLPVLDISRTPGRFNFVVGLCMAMMAAYGVAHLPTFPSLKRFTDSRLAQFAVVVLIALILFDYQSFFPLPTVRADVPDAITALGQREDVRAVFNIPWDNLLAAKEALYLQTAHGLPLIAGQVTRQTPVDPAMLNVLQQTLDPALLYAAGADVVIVHRAGFYDADGTLFNHAQQSLGEPIYVDDRFAVFNVPITAEGTAYQNVIPLPAFDNQTDVYVFSAQSGWAEIYVNSTNIEAEPTRSVDFSLDGEPIAVPDLSNGITYIPIAESGYHTITVNAEPTCPVMRDASLVCPDFYVSTHPPTIYFLTDAFDNPTSFANGVTLRDGNVLLTGNGEVTLLLWWQFDEPYSSNSIRFIKILDASGEQIFGVDNALPVHSSQYAETIRVPFPTVSSEYRVYVGWYTHPDLTRFPIISGGGDERAQDGLAYIGSFTIESP